MNYLRMRDSIEGIARAAGDFLLRNFGQDLGLVERRISVKEIVTTYDKVADELIIEEIKNEYPEHSLLTEESGFVEGDPDWLWIVDSLDGTGDFANLNPFFCVCIALMHEQQLVLGVTYAPAIGELYVAESGGGAYLNGRKIEVSRVSDLRESYFFYCEGGEKDRARTGRILARVYPEVMDIRKLGSAGLETAWVAAGKGEVYFTTKIEPWDVAPGVLLVREAGGEVTDFEGNPWRLETSDLVFSNGTMHSNILDLLREEQDI